MSRPKITSRQQTIRFAFATATVVVVLGISWLIQRPLRLWDWQDFRNGDLVIQRIEAFRVEKGHLPESLEELGANDLSEHIYYQRVEAQDYRVWFSIGVGESETYESSTKRWQ